MSFWNNNFPFSRNTDSDLRQLIEKYYECSDTLEKIPEIVSEYVTESGLISNLQSNLLLDTINVRYDWGDLKACAGDGVTDDTANLQAFIDYASANKKALYIPAGTYLINTAGQMDGGSVARDYCIKLPSNTKIYGESRDNTIFVTKSIDSDLFTSLRNSLTKDIELYNFGINGSGSLAGSDEGFGLWLYNSEHFKIGNIKINNCANWNCRLELCKYFYVNDCIFNGGINTNSDACHLVDCSYGNLTNIYCYSRSDDGFVLEANTRPTHDIFVNNLCVELKNAIGLAPRGIGMFASNDMSLSHYNIIITNASVSSNGFDVQISTCTAERIYIQAVCSGTGDGLYLQDSARSDDKEGLIQNCRFDIQKTDGVNALVMAHISGVIKDNVINVTASRYSGYVQLTGNGNVYNLHLNPKKTTSAIGVLEGSSNLINLQFRDDAVDTSAKFTINSGQQNILNVHQLGSGGGVHVSSNNNQINGILRTALTTSGTGNQNNTFVP